MRRPLPVIQAVVSLALWPLIMIFFPVVLVAGEPLNRYVLRLAGRKARSAQAAAIRNGDRPPHAMTIATMPTHVTVLFLVIRNPLWIALTAPGRWVADRFR
jgi:hypothetical protein